MTEWKKALKTEVSPWDIYFVYDSKSHWKLAATETDYWQQQLGSLKILPPNFSSLN